MVVTNVVKTNLNLFKICSFIQFNFHHINCLSLDVVLIISQYGIEPNKGKLREDKSFMGFLVLAMFCSMLSTCGPWHYNLAQRTFVALSLGYEDKVVREKNNRLIDPKGEKICAQLRLKWCLQHYLFNLFFPISYEI